MDILPGEAGSHPQSLTPVGDSLYFTAEDAQHGRELWKTDGTVAGTVMVDDLFPGGETYDDELYPYSSNPTDLTAAGVLLFFVAETENSGRELWMAGGDGATMLADLTPGLDAFGWPRSSEPHDLTFYGLHTDESGESFVDPALYFSAESVLRGRELYKADLFGNVSLLKNIHEDRPGQEPESSDPSNLFVFQNRLYFSATDGEWDDENQEFLSHGAELWRSDGTPEGTALLRDIRSGSASSSPSDLTPADNGVYFVADGGQGRELWFTDATGAGTQLVSDIRPGSNGSFPEELTALGNSLVFSASDGTNGRELWISDSTSGGTQMLKDIRPGSNLANGEPENLANIGGTVYFKANDVWHGRELWRTDGTSAGTVLMDIPSVATLGSTPEELVSFHGRLFFAATSDLHGSELWKSDGTTAGTVLVKDIDSGASSYPSDFVAVDDLVFFEADSGATGRELWVSDGTADGTHLVLDIQPGSLGSNPHDMVSWNGVLYFAAEGPDGVELYRSDGTADVAKERRTVWNYGSPTARRPVLSCIRISIRPRESAANHGI